MNNLTENAKKFLARNPTLIGIVLNVRFYEHPEYGDECDLLMILPDGQLQHSGFYELPQEFEVQYILDDITRS